MLLDITAGGLDVLMTCQPLKPDHIRSRDVHRGPSTRTKRRRRESISIPTKEAERPEHGIPSLPIAIPDRQSREQKVIVGHAFSIASKERQRLFVVDANVYEAWGEFAASPLGRLEAEWIELVSELAGVGDAATQLYSIAEA